MKYLISIILFILLLFAGQELANAKDYSNSPVLTAQISTVNANTKASVSNQLQMSIEETTDSISSAKGVVVNNWGSIIAALLAVSEVLTRLIPSVKDNSIFNFFSRIINAVIPNNRKTGGTF